MSKKESETPATDADLEHDRTRVTPEIGDEGGSPGEVEIGRDRAPATGSEATETSRPGDRRPGEINIVRDEAGEGRRRP